MSKKYRVWLISLVCTSITCVSLTACGTKGPLYIPEQRYPQTPSVKPNTTPNVDKSSSDTQVNGL